MGRFRGSLRSRLFVAFLAMLVPVVALLAYELYSDYTRRVSTVLGDQVQTAAAVGAVVDAVFDEGQTVARGLAAEPELANQDPAFIDSYLQSRRSLISRYVSVTLVDISGNVVATSVASSASPTGQPRVSIADRPYFKRLLATGQETMSDVIVGRLVNEPLIAFAAPVRDSGGTLRGALVVSLDVNRLPERLSGIPTRPGQRILLTDLTGRLAFGTGMTPITWAERDYSGFEQIQRALAGEVVVEDNYYSPQLHDYRLAVFTASSEHGWVVGVSQNRALALDAITATALRETTAALGLVVLAIVLGVTLSRRLLAPIQKLTRESRALGRGLGQRSAARVADSTLAKPSRVRPAGEDELELLTATFAEMSSEVRQRVEEVEAANARLSALMEAATNLVLQTSPAGVAEVCVENGRQILGADFAALWVLDPKAEELRLLGSRCLVPQTTDDLRMISCSSDTLFAQALGDRKVVSADYSASPTSATWSLVREEGLQRLIAVPLPVRHQRAGVAAFGRRAARDFTLVERQAAETLAGMLAVALERAALFEDLNLALRVREEFLNLAAHELKTPLTTLKGYVQLLDRRSDRGIDERRLIESLNSQSNRMGRLVETLLDVSQLQSGSLVLHSTPVDLRELAAEIAGELNQSLPRHTVSVRGESGVLVAGDRARIRGVIFSLLDNALKFSPQGGEVEVSVRGTPEDGVVSIRDQGIGIPKEKQAELFQIFYQVAPMVRPTTGMGLGLYICREIVQRHGGKIWFASEAGKGSTFSFSLPRNVEVRSDAATAAPPLGRRDGEQRAS